MSTSSKPNPEVQPKAERRRFNAEYKRRMVAEADQDWITSNWDKTIAIMDNIAINIQEIIDEAKR